MGWGQAGVRSVGWVGVGLDGLGSGWGIWLQEQRSPCKPLQAVAPGATLGGGVRERASDGSDHASEI